MRKESLLPKINSYSITLSLNSCDVTVVVGCDCNVAREKLSFLIEGADIVCADLIKAVFNS